MKEIKDEDILAAFKLKEKDPEDKIFHGVIRRGGDTVVMFESKSGHGYSGFVGREKFDLSNLNPTQLNYLRGKGYSIEQ